jgi:hypothetical protein
VATTHYRHNKNTKKSKSWLHQHKQGGHMHDIGKWMTPQERKNFKNKNNSNFKDEILKTNYSKQSNFNECQWFETAV